jgi:ubiquinone/menaquinone biosynthesis C-methylase UbiE
MNEVFDQMTERYDAWYDSAEGRPLYESELLCLAPLVDSSSGPLLEIGVGTGRFAMHFPGITGIDPSGEALAIAEKRGVKTVIGCGEALPFPDETFGCVLLIVTLCFVKNPLQVIREAKRVMKKDGAIIIGFVPADSPWGRFYREKKRGGHPFYKTATFYAIEQLETLLSDAGLKIAQIRSTLLQKPDEPRRFEQPVDHYEKDAGFLCIRIQRNYSL